MNNNNLYKRPMFRKGGSAEGGITSGLQAPRQGYQEGNDVQKFDTNQNIAEFLKNASISDQQKLVEQMYPPSAGTRMPKRRFNDFLIDFGLDIASRPAGSNIFETAAASAKDPFKRFQDARSQEELLMEKNDLDRIWVLRKVLAQLSSIESMEFMVEKIYLHVLTT